MSTRYIKTSAIKGGSIDSTKLNSTIIGDIEEALTGVEELVNNAPLVEGEGDKSIKSSNDYAHADGDFSVAIGGADKDMYISHIRLSGEPGATTYTYDDESLGEEDYVIIEKAIEQQTPIYTRNVGSDGKYSDVRLNRHNSDGMELIFSGTLDNDNAVSNVPFLIYYIGDADNCSIHANGIASYIEGINGIADGFSSHVEGWGNHAKGGYTHVEGFSNVAQGLASHIEGQHNTTTPFAPYSHVEGIYCVVNATRGHAEGYGTTVNGDQGHAEGSGTIANGYASHAEGEKCKSIGSYSHAEGKSNTASGSCSHAEGLDNDASGYVSHAEGRSVSASGRYSHAEGWQTKSEGDTSHAEGRANTASGTYAHAEGYKTISSGQASHSEGRNTQATAYGAHAEGNGCIAAGVDSHASGVHTVAGHAAETAIGKYNISRENYGLYGGADGSYTIFSVGVGSASASANALEISNRGDVFVNKQIYVGDPAIIDDAEDTKAKHRVVTGEEFDLVKDKVDDFFDTANLKDETIDTLKEIQDYIDSDASAAQEMLNQINEAKKSAVSAHTNINAKIAAVKIDLDKKLESDNLKTINGNSIVGTGNLEIVPYAQVSLLDIQNSNFKVIPGQWYEITGYYEEDPSFTLIGLAIGNDKFAPKGFAKRVIEGGNVEVYEVMFDATIKSGNIEGVEEWSYNIQSSTISDFLENFTVEPIASNHLVVIPKYDTDDSGIINGENNPTDYIFDTTTPIYESPILATQSYPLTMSLAQAEVLKEIFSGSTPYAPSYSVEVETRVEDNVESKVITSVTRDGEAVEENNFFSVDGLFEERISSYWNEDEDRVYLEITLKYDNNESSFTLTSDVYDVIVEISDMDDQYSECLKNILAPKLLYTDTVSDYNVYFMLSGIKVKEDKIWTNLVALHPVTSEEDTIVFTPLYLEDSSGNYEQCDVLLEDGECDHWSNYGHIPITFDLESNYTNNIKETIGTFNAKILHMKDSRGNEAPYDFIHTTFTIDNVGADMFTFSTEDGNENSANCSNNIIMGTNTKPNVFFVGNVQDNTLLVGASNIIIKSSRNFIGPGTHEYREITAGEQSILKL